jgi:hypothetical protein
LVFWYGVAPKKGATEERSEAATWVGEVVTNEVPIEVAGETDQGLLPSVAERRFPESLKAANEVLRIGESKPVTVNDAQFVIVAESDWRSGKGNVPIDLQLRITNLGKEELLFDTFDAFGVGLKDGAGKPIFPGGGRRGTAITRPIVIPPGTSYSLCRKAELRWNAETKANELFYWDGTGFIRVFRALQPGRAKVRFWYAVGDNPPLKPLLRPERQSGDPLTWLGGLDTNEVLIEVRTP